MKKLVGMIILTPLFVLASTAHAGETYCGAPGFGEILATGTHDDVTVIGGVCNVDFFGTTKVKGDIKVEPGGELRATLFPGGKLIVRGSVQCDFCFQITLVANVGSTMKVKGDVQIKGAQAPSSFLAISGGKLRVGGNVQIEEMTRHFNVIGAKIGGDVQVFKNVTTTGPIISANTIGGNLQCKENTTAPVASVGPNVVEGNKEDQCAASLGF